jgi:hypothetical protein
LVFPSNCFSCKLSSFTFTLNLFSFNSSAFHRPSNCFVFYLSSLTRPFNSSSFDSSSFTFPLNSFLLFLTGTPSSVPQIAFL